MNKMFTNGLMVSMHRLLEFAILLMYCTCNAQTSKYWVWGLHAGMNFDKKVPVVQPSKLYSFFLATLCDSQGKNLLYSNEKGIYDRNQDLMPHGLKPSHDYIGPIGSVIIPFRNAKIFAFDLTYTDLSHQTYHSNGLYYSILDLSLNNGLGDVDTSSKNIRLLRGNILQLYALQNDSGTYWLIARTQDTTYAYPIDSKGIHKPVQTFTPEAVASLYFGNAFGVSHDHKFMISSRSVGIYSETNQFWVYAYDFDQYSGHLSNQRLLKYGKNFIADNDNCRAYYDVAFSPNDSVFYLTDIGPGLSSYHSLYYSRFILQMQRYAKDTAGASYYFKVKNPLHAPTSGIKLGPDKKMYVMYDDESGWVSSLAVINKPDIIGPACNIVLNQVGKNLGGEGFPFEATDYISAGIKYDGACTSSYINNSSAKFRSFTWYFGDGDSSLAANPIHRYKKSGKYSVALKALTEAGYESWDYDTISYYKKPVASFSYLKKSGCQWIGFQFMDSSTCDTFNVHAGKSWHWDFGDGSTDTSRNPVHIYTRSGIYTVRLIFSNGFCTDTAIKFQDVNILTAPKPGLRISDSKLCAPSLVHVIDNSIGDVTSYKYTFGDNTVDSAQNPAHFMRAPGTHWISQQVTGPTGCITKDSIQIQISPGVSAADSPLILYASVVQANQIKIEWAQVANCQKYTLFKSINGQLYSPLATIMAPISFFTDNDAATRQENWYKLIAEDSCGQTTSASRVAKSILLKAESLGNDAAVLKWTPYEDWSQDFDYHILAGSSFNEIQIGSANMYQLLYNDQAFFQDSQLEKCYSICAVNKITGARSYSNKVCLSYKPVLWIPNAFSPNKDGHNDRFTVKAIGIRDYAIHIYNLWGELVYVSNDPLTGWDGSYKGEPVQEGIYIYKIEAKGAISGGFYYTGNIRVLR